MDIKKARQILNKDHEFAEEYRVETIKQAKLQAFEQCLEAVSGGGERPVSPGSLIMGERLIIGDDKAVWMDGYATRDLEVKSVIKQLMEEVK